MTFSVVLEQTDQSKKVVGILWAADEAGARAMIPNLASALTGSVHIERAQEREIPLKIRETDAGRHINFMSA